MLESVIILTIIGIGAGMLGSVIGVGGGIIMTPALTVMGFAPPQISSTSLIAVTFTSASSTIAYSKQKRIDYAVGLKMAALAIPGAVIGAFVSSLISLESFRIYFAILLMLAGMYIAYKNSIIKEQSKERTKPKLYYLFFYAGTFSAGIISSLFGIGGGIIFVPMMIILLGMTMLKAAPTSQLALLITSVAGSFAHAILGHPDYIHALFLSVGAFAGGHIGATISDRVKETILRKLLSILLISIAIKIIVDFIEKLYNNAI